MKKKSKKSAKKPVPFGYYFCMLDERLYIKEPGFLHSTLGFIEDTCWFKSMEDGEMLPYSISFDERYHEGHLEFLGAL